MSEYQDYYEILRVSENATIGEIKQSFRRLVRDCHPDLHPNDDKAAQRFRLLREAYEVLSDENQRTRYDRNRKNPSSSDSPQTEGSPQVYYVRGVEKIIIQNYRGAIADLSEAIRLNGRFIEAYLKRCEAYLAIGEERAVLEDCQRILRYQPDSAIAYYYRGRARQRLGYTDAAIKAYSQAIRLNQDFPSPYYYRGVAHYELRYRSRAIADWREYGEICKQQGNIQGYRLAMDTLSRYSWIQIKINDRTLGQWWRLGQDKLGSLFQKRPRRPSRSWSVPKEQVERFFQESRNKSFYFFAGFQDTFNQLLFSTGFGIKTSFKILRQILSNPAGGILPAYGALTPKMASIVSVCFILLAETSFIIGMSFHFGGGGNGGIGWLILGLIPLVSLFLMSLVTRSILQHLRHWTGDLFFASSAVLPSAFFCFLTGLFGFRLNFIFLVGAVFTLSHTILLLYGGCSQLLNLPESLSSLVVPSMILVTTLLTWVGFFLLS